MKSLRSSGALSFPAFAVCLLFLPAPALLGEVQTSVVLHLDRFAPPHKQDGSSASGCLFHPCFSFLVLRRGPLFLPPSLPIARTVPCGPLAPCGMAAKSGSHFSCSGKQLGSAGGSPIFSVFLFDNAGACC